MTDLGLKGRAALVTGASRNIGRAIALALAEAGASIAIVARSDREAAEAVAREVEAFGVKAKVLIGDVASEADAARLVSEAASALGRLDILVNNAAIRREAPVEELSYKDWRDVISVTLDGAFLMSRAAIPSGSDAPASGTKTGRTPAMMPHETRASTTPAAVRGAVRAMPSA